MAFDPAPTNLFAGWSENGTNITLPIAAVPELTAAEADAATGDVRKVIFALLEQMFQYYNGLAAADRPSKLSCTKASTPNTSTGKVANTYTFRVETGIVAQEVSDEPA